MGKKNILEKLVRSIEEDRSTVMDLIADLKAKLLTGKSTYEQAGDVMAKFMLASTRNNEQLTQVYAAIVKAEPKGENAEEVSEADLEKIFDHIQEEKVAAKEKEKKN
jgi:hypothetical protein